VPLSGMTLVEVLVAMVILLVGIWAVASGFPKLFGVLAGEEKRTEMSRLAEGTVERLKTDPYALPLAISGGPTIHPDSVPSVGGRREFCSAGGRSDYNGSSACI